MTIPVTATARILNALRAAPLCAALWLAAAAGLGQAGEDPARLLEKSQPLAAEPLVIRDLDAPVNILDVAYGYYGGWAATDGIGDQILDLTFTGGILRTAPLNLYMVNIYPADGKYFFNAADSNGRFRVGFEKNFNVRGTFLPAGFLSQGSSLAVRPDDNGATTSNQFAQANLFKADQIYSLTPLTLKPQLRGGMDVGPLGYFYVGYSSGIQVVSPDGTSSTLGNYAANVTAIRACGDGLWVGTSASIDWVTVSNGIGSLMRYPTQNGILSVDCGGNGSAVASGTLGTLYYVNPAQSVFQGFQVQGGTNLIKVALGPGVAVRGLVLDSANGLGTLKSFSLNAAYGITRDTTTNRLQPLAIRTVF
ncbi:MAG TPA: hypothetical protein VKH43_03370 [Thermoanaerobaculia bacterium]|nr:hypothetical protein [Thermoanaerobaculia bacterium]